MAIDIVDFPMKIMCFPIVMLVYQRVSMIDLRCIPVYSHIIPYNYSISYNHQPTEILNTARLIFKHNKISYYPLVTRTYIGRKTLRTSFGKRLGH